MSNDIFNYLPVIEGEYNRELGRYAYPIGNDGRMLIMEGSHVVKTIRRLQEGKTHVTADPIYTMSRYEAAWLLNNAERIIGEVGE